MKRFIIFGLLLVVFSGCNQTDSTRLDNIEHEGTECVVVRSGVGKIIAIDCNWKEN